MTLDAVETGRAVSFGCVSLVCNWSGCSSGQNAANLGQFFIYSTCVYFEGLLVSRALYTQSTDLHPSETQRESDRTVTPQTFAWSWMQALQTMRKAVFAGCDARALEEKCECEMLYVLQAAQLVMSACTWKYWPKWSIQRVYPDGSLMFFSGKNVGRPVQSRFKASKGLTYLAFSGSITKPNKKIASTDRFLIGKQIEKRETNDSNECNKLPPHNDGVKIKTPIAINNNADRPTIFALFVLISNLLRIHTIAACMCVKLLISEANR